MISALNSYPNVRDAIGDVRSSVSIRLLFKGSEALI